jgi:hypothetical protein
VAFLSSLGASVADGERQIALPAPSEARITRLSSDRHDEDYLESQVTALMSDEQANGKKKGLNEVMSLSPLILSRTSVKL